MWRGYKCFMSCSIVYQTLEYFDHLAYWFQLSLSQYLDCYETDSHTKKCFGDQFCSSVLLCAFLSMSTLFVSGMDVKYLSNRYRVCVIYCLILVGYAKLLKLVSRLVGSPFKSNSKGNLATKETWNYVQAPVSTVLTSRIGRGSYDGNCILFGHAGPSLIYMKLSPTHLINVWKCVMMAGYGQQISQQSWTVFFLLQRAGTEFSGRVAIHGCLYIDSIAWWLQNACNLLFGHVFTTSPKLPLPTSCLDHCKCMSSYVKELNR